jgi:LysM repeat protein
MYGWVRALLAGSLAGILAGCAGAQPSPTAASTVTLKPYRTSTALAVGSSGATIAPLPTAGPSLTPMAYAVHANDTFLAIALAYGLTREELLAANPGINPDILSIGQQLLIPAPGGQGTATPIPTPTPLPLRVAEPRCFPNATAGLWCLVSVTNTTEGPVEGLSGLLTLIDRSGNPLLTVPVYPPLNLVPAQQTMVLAAYLSPPVLEYERVAVALTMAVQVQQAESRYAEMDWSVVRSQPRSDRQSWDAEVEVRLPADSANLWRVALAVLAYDDQGNVIGFAKWEADESLRPGEQTRASLTVFSLGPTIDRIDVLAEAMPAQ